jgi:hypothetical protein
LVGFESKKSGIAIIKKIIRARRRIYLRIGDFMALTLEIIRLTELKFKDSSSTPAANPK